jgi:Flp pilus assembly protein TadG
MAVVEFALLAPLLVSLVLGMFELARGLMVKEMLSDAAQKGCRTGVLPGKTNSDITSDVNNILADNGIASTDVTTTIQVNGRTADLSTANPNDKISVKVAIPVAKVYWVGTVFLSAQSVESETVVMLRQG